MSDKKIDPGLFEYEPKEVEDEEVWEMMAIRGVSPSVLPDPKDRASYEAYLAEYKTKVAKANPYHGKGGLFTSKDKAGTGGDGGWVKVGHQKGSNAGGVYEKDGKQVYTKFPSAKGQAMAEEVADRFYDALGVGTLHHRMKNIGGKEASVSDMNKDLVILGKSGWKRLTPEQEDQAAKIVLASVLVKNWDVVGLEYDNVAMDGSDILTIVDTGGSFTYRAQGAHKDFDGSAEAEMKAFMSPEKTSGRVLKPLYDRNPGAFTKAAKAIANLDEKALKGLVKGLTAMPEDEALKALKERQRKIVETYGTVEKGDPPTPSGYANVFKANPYHGKGGKFTSKDKAGGAMASKPPEKLAERTPEEEAIEEGAPRDLSMKPDPKYLKEVLKNQPSFDGVNSREMVLETDEDEERVDKYYADVEEMNKAVTPLEKEALRGYTEDDFKPINMAAARAAAGVKDEYSSQRTLQQVRAMDSAIEKSTLQADLQVARFVKADRFAQKVGLDPSSLSKMSEDKLKGLVGKEFLEPGYSSTSKGVSEFYWNPHDMDEDHGDSNTSVPVRMVINTQKGQKALDTHKISNNWEETEVIFPRGAGFKITGVSRGPEEYGGALDVQLEYLGAVTPPLK